MLRTRLIHLLLNSQVIDIHVAVDEPVRVRTEGEMARMDVNGAKDGDLREFLAPCRDCKAPAALLQARGGSWDCALSLASWRMRGNLFTHAGERLALVTRRLPRTSPGFAVFGLPEALRVQRGKQKGLALVAGPRRSGTATTLAASASQPSCGRPVSMVTVEHPIDYLVELARGGDFSLRGRSGYRTRPPRRTGRAATGVGCFSGRSDER